MRHYAIKITVFLTCLIWSAVSVPCRAESGEDLSLYATAAVLMDAASGRVLYEKKGGDVLAMASTTKIMTCILTLENGNPDDTVDISAYASSMPKVKLYVKKGEQYRLGDLLHSLMLESHNDSAVAIAEHIGKAYLPELQGRSAADFTGEESQRAVAAFAALMNAKARDIGCENTWFITPNGLDATQAVKLDSGEEVVKEHTTTAADLARMMSYCITRSPKREEFLNITRSPSYSFSANGRSYSCANHNAFLNMMDGALTGKTGFTSKAGYCYVGALERDGRIYVVALLACGWPNNKTYKWSDTRELMQYGLDNYTYHSLDEAAYDESGLKPIQVLEGQPAGLGGEAYTGVKIAGRGGGNTDTVKGLLLREDERIEVSCEMERALRAPVTAGTQVGSITYSVDGKVYRTEQILTTNDVDKIDFEWCLRQVLRRFLPAGRQTAA